MNVFICTHFCDVHAILVEHVLNSQGHQVFRWISEASTDVQRHSVSYGDQHFAYRMEQGSQSVDLADIDAVWWRRLNDITLPNDVNRGDVDLSIQEWRAVHTAIPTLISERARWINPWSGRLKGGMKLLQLRAAQRAGFSVPNTLVSNVPGEIREFVAAQKHGAVHKMFGAASWRDELTIVRSRTTRVLPQHLTDARVLSLCPGVFQERVPKAKELRATFMGEQCICVSIDPQDDPQGVCDWRSIPFRSQTVRRYNLPAEVEAQCLAIMNSLDIVFGCFDILLTDDGQYIFLEVNEQGQFLWIEHLDPSIKMLEHFCNFVVGETFETPGLSDVFYDPVIQDLIESEDHRADERIMRLAAVP